MRRKTTPSRRQRRWAVSLPLGRSTSTRQAGERWQGQWLPARYSIHGGLFRARVLVWAWGCGYGLRFLSAGGLCRRSPTRCRTRRPDSLAPTYTSLVDRRAADWTEFDSCVIVCAPGFDTAPIAKRNVSASGLSTGTRSGLSHGYASRPKNRKSLTHQRTQAACSEWTRECQSACWSASVCRAVPA